MTKQEAKQQIQKLIDKYKRIEDADDLNSYNEARTRNEFIEPLFEFLGWDMRNLNNANEVIPEESSSGGRIDLAFRINNIPVMFLEAKALGKNLDDPQWAEQVINYSWNKGVTWAVLTDFETIKVFNAETPPKDPEKNKFLELSWQSYISDFDDLWMLSKEGFSQGLLAKKAEKYGGLVKRKPVGDKLFEDLTAWRALLTKSVGRSNKLSEEELDHGIQKILDRLVFIRTAEDRKLEANVLQSILHSWESRGQKGNLYEQLVSTFRNFDEGYDSTLFGPHNSEKWEINNDAIAQVINGLYKTKDGYRYDFAAISVDVLGSIYQHYLGYVQQKSKKGAEIAESKKRKKQGIFYTPRYIADFIVKETLGEVLKKTKPKDISKIKVLDPACGSGSFLTAAYDKFISYYEKQKRPKDQINLFTKLDILKNNLYGVDLDAQAVEIAQLNLLLKVLFQRGERLPDLQHNIRNGNSLISGEEISLKPYFGDNWRDQKPFNWEEEFKEVFDQGGFDVIIGNPPYLKEMNSKEIFATVKSGDYAKYYQGKMDLWHFFLHRAIDICKEDGYIGFITNSYFLKSAGASKLIERIKNELVMIRAVDFGDIKVFGDVSGKHIVHIYQKRRSQKSDKTIYIDVSQDEFRGFIDEKNKIEIPYQKLIANNKINFEVTGGFDFKKCNPLGEIYDVSQGVVEGPDKVNQKNADKYHLLKGSGVFVVNRKELDSLKLNEQEKSFVRKYLDTKNVGRYEINFDDEYLLYLTKENCPNIKLYPRLEEHLKKFMQITKNRRETLKGSNEWFQMHWPREDRYFENKKLICKSMFLKPEFCYDEDKYYVGFSFSVIIQKDQKYSLKYLLALLNSSLGKQWFHSNGKKRGVGVDIGVAVFRQFPVREATIEQQKKIEVLVDKIMELQKQFHNTLANTNKQHLLKSDIEKLDREIDQEVYKLYGLTEKDIRIIENE